MFKYLAINVSFHGSMLQIGPAFVHEIMHTCVTQSREMSKIFNFETYTSNFVNLNMLHFDANPIKIGHPVTEL